MADQNRPNDASRNSKAEGERWSPDENAVDDERSEYMSSDEHAGGITNRPLDEEMSNQESIPERGKAKSGAHAGHADDNDQPRRKSAASERSE